MTRIRRDLLLVVVACLAAVPALAVAAPASAVAAPGGNCAEAKPVDEVVPWARGMLVPESVWPFSRGGGVTVAVLSTGVDREQPRLRGRVVDGFDAITEQPGATADCTGAGTQVAGVIAAQPADADGLTGLAPQALIMPVRVVADDPLRTAVPTAAPLARGITWAAEHRAGVIVVTAPLRRPDAAVQAAVKDAVLRGITVVAAAGDLGEPQDGNPTTYPAAYADVLGVGAVAVNGQVWASSQHGDYVDLVAPGVGVTTLQRGGGLTQVDGTAVAAGFVAGAVALMRSKRGDLVGGDIARTLVATASPTMIGPAYGAGVVNPYAAVTEQRSGTDARALPAMTPVPRPDTGAARRRRSLALTGAGLAGLAVLAVLVVAAAARRGRRRRWHPAVTAAPVRPPEPLEPGPPAMLLDEPAESTRQ